MVDLPVSILAVCGTGSFLSVILLVAGFIQNRASFSTHKFLADSKFGGRDDEK
jgi:hypothetical protein